MLLVIVGDLVELPEMRELPSGTALASFSLTVRLEGQKTTSVPLSWIDPPAKLQKWRPGDSVIATGAVVRRFYQAGGATGSRTDVDVGGAELVKHRARSDQVLNRAVGVLNQLRLRLDSG